MGVFSGVIFVPVFFSIYLSVKTIRHKYMKGGMVKTVCFCFVRDCLAQNQMGREGDDGEGAGGCAGMVSKASARFNLIWNNVIICNAVQNSTVQYR